VSIFKLDGITKGTLEHEFLALMTFNFYVMNVEQWGIFDIFEPQYKRFENSFTSFELYFIGKHLDIIFDKSMTI